MTVHVKKYLMEGLRSGGSSKMLKIKERIFQDIQNALNISSVDHLVHFLEEMYPVDDNL